MLFKSGLPRTGLQWHCLMSCMQHDPLHSFHCSHRRLLCYDIHYPAIPERRILHNQQKLTTHTKAQGRRAPCMRLHPPIYPATHAGRMRLTHKEQKPPLLIQKRSSISAACSHQLHQLHITQLFPPSRSPQCRPNYTGPCVKLQFPRPQAVTHGSVLYRESSSLPMVSLFMLAMRSACALVSPVGSSLNRV